MERDNCARGLTQIVGNNFERFVESRVPELDKISSGGREPDFYCPSGKFWIEAKVGNQKWGPRIKRYQTINFLDLKDPVIYALGFHDFDNARERLSGYSPEEMVQIVEKEMGFSKVVFVSSDIVKKLWEVEHRISENGASAYFTAKQNIFNNIWERKPFKRFGKRIDSAEEYYGFNFDDYYMQGWDRQGGIMTPQNDIGNYGFILNLEKEGGVIQHLERLGLKK